MDTYSIRGARSQMTGHYRRPGTRDLYCGRPAGSKNGHGATLRGWKMCTPCVKAEAADRAAAEAVADSHDETAPSLAERAGVTLAMVGRGRRPHYTDGTDTLCGRPLDTDHRAEAAALRVKGGERVCQPCTRAAEEIAYVATLTGSSHLAAAAAGLAATVEQADAEREQAAAQRVVIIPCGAAKLDREAPAAELYTGSYHRACARAAAALTATGGTVVILSALHGLVPLDRMLAPYEMRMGDPGSVTADVLRQQARELGLDRATDVTILAGLSYTAPALAVWPHASTPLAGLAGMGHHMRALAAIADGEQEPADEEAPALYAPRGLRNLTTGHLLDETTGRAYCGAELAGPNGAAVLTCAACRHVRDHQPADALEADLDAQFARAARAVDAVTHAEETGAPVTTLADADALYAAQLVTEADATAGTWRGEWIGERTTTTAPALFDLAAEQGALFA